MIRVHQEPGETRQRAAAALPGLRPVQGVVPARAEQAEALVDRKAVDPLEALGEADPKLAL